jgi:hypothetical protein
LSEVEKTRGGVDGFSLDFGIIMAIRLRDTALPVKTRSVENTHENNSKVVYSNCFLKSESN